MTHPNAKPPGARAVRGISCPPCPPRPRHAPPTVVAVLLSDGRGWTWTDPEIADRFRDWRWRKRDARGYIVLTKGTQRISLHRAILRPSRKQVVDHIDGERHHNWRENLRAVRHARNAQTQHVVRGTTSKFYGVFRERGRGLWYVQVVAFGKRYFVGRFVRERDAAMAYDCEARRRHGAAFAKQNFPQRRQ